MDLSHGEAPPKYDFEEYKDANKVQGAWEEPAKEQSATKGIVNVVLIVCVYAVSIMLGVHVPIVGFRLFGIKGSVFDTSNVKLLVTWIILSYISFVILLIPCGAVFLKYRYFVKKAAQLSLIYPLVKKYVN